MNANPFRPSSHRDHAVPQFWSQPKLSLGVEAQNALFDQACKTPRYDGSERVWDQLLEILTLGLCYQPAIAIVLKEGLWRDATNKRAYIATAAYRQALKLKLRDFSEKDFRRVKQSRAIDNEGPGVEYFDQEHLSHQDEFEILQFKAASNLAERSGSFVTREQEGEFSIPRWLWRNRERQVIDWQQVARRAALKPAMAIRVAQVLELRFEKELSRDKAKATVSSRAEMKEIDAAWKWIDRNWESRIKPVFSTDQWSSRWTETPSRAERGVFIPAWVAIQQACRREKQSGPKWVYPSIMTDDKCVVRFALVECPSYLHNRFQPQRMAWARTAENLNVQRSRVLCPQPEQLY